MRQPSIHIDELVMTRPFKSVLYQAAFALPPELYDFVCAETSNRIGEQAYLFELLKQAAQLPVSQFTPRQRRLYYRLVPALRLAEVMAARELLRRPEITNVRFDLAGPKARTFSMVAKRNSLSMSELATIVAWRRQRQ